MIVHLKRFWIQLTADRKRFGILCAVLGVGLLFWARLIVVSNLPRTAVADGQASGSVMGTQQTSDLRPPTSELRTSNSELSTDKSGARGAVPQIIRLHAEPRRDPFVISQSHFPKPTAVANSTKEAPKSQSEPAEDSSQAEARVTAQLRSLVDEFKLEAVMNPMAVINGRTYRVGDWVPSKTHVQFQLQQVKHRSVILEVQDRRFELQMAGPGSNF